MSAPLQVLRALRHRATELLRGRHLRHELDEEFAFHLAMEAEQNERQGMSRAEAVRAATLAFGGIQRMREATMDARGFVGLANAARDLRFAMRRMRHRPGFASAAIITVALSVAAATAVGTMVYSVLLKPLPYPDADRLVVIGHDAPGLGLAAAGQAGALDALYRSGSTSLEQTALYLVSDNAVSITDGNAPERATIAMIQPRLLPMLGARVMLGRPFTDADADEDMLRVILSHALWQRRYGSDSSVVGRYIELNRQRAVIVGVMSPSFVFPEQDIGLWYARGPDTVSAPLTLMYYRSIARLKPGVSPEAAERDLSRLLVRLPERVPDVTAAQLEQARLRPRVRGLQASLVAEVRSELMLLGVAVAGLLLIAVVNLANLFILRAESVHQEIAVSRALGARTSDVIRRFLGEGLVVAALGGLAAIPLTLFGIASRFGFGSTQIPRLREVELTPWPVVVIGLVCIGITILLTAAAVLRTRHVAIGEGTRGGSRQTAGPSWSRLQRLLVGGQVALALALLTTSALAGKSLWKLRSVDLGFDASRTLVFDLPLPFSPYRTYMDAVRFHGQLLDSLRAMPGVSAAEAAAQLPLRGTRAEMIEQFAVAGAAPGQANATVGFASPGYFSALSMPVLQGRAFQSSDVRDAPGVILTRSMAMALFGRMDVIGQRIRYAGRERDYPPYEIVGVVGDTYGSSIADGVLNVVYFPIAVPLVGDVTPSSRYTPRGGTSIVVRTLGDPMAILPSVRRVMQQVDRQVPLANVTTLSAMEAGATARARLVLLLLGLASVTSLVLGAVGLYGVMAYSVASRRRELGIRLAMGATPRGVLQSVLREGAAVTVIGSLAGISGGVALGRLMRGLLYEVSPVDSSAFLVAVGLTVCVSALATWIPARRAAAIDPAIALRGE